MACVSACPARRLYLIPRWANRRKGYSCPPAAPAPKPACRKPQAAGRLMTVEEIMAEIDKDAMFYEQPAE